MISRYLSVLGFTQEHLDKCLLPETEEAFILADAGFDVFDRALQMTPATLNSWLKLDAAAVSDSVSLQIVSGFRSIEYQCGIIERKLKQGNKLDDILKVSAIPGYSEHHTGRALDLSTPDCPPLEEAFEDTAAFTWLTKNAHHFEFEMSYPKNNSAGIVYEPWHWAFQGDETL